MIVYIVKLFLYIFIITIIWFYKIKNKK